MVNLSRLPQLSPARPGAAPHSLWWPELALALLAWGLGVVVLNHPGHLSFDSTVQVIEGRSLVFESWNPKLISLVFGQVSLLGNSPALLVLISTGLLGLSVYLLIPRPGGSATPVTVLVCTVLLLPIGLIYPAIVWKDVWFAHLALIGFGLLVLTHHRRFWLYSTTALLAFALAAASRQTGALVAAVGLVVWASLPATSELRGLPKCRFFLIRLTVATTAFVALGGVLSIITNRIAISATGAPTLTGMRLVATFDIAGMIQRNPEIHLDHYAKLGFQTNVFEAAARRSFSAERVDKLDLPALFGAGHLELKDVLKQHSSLIWREPVTYLAHRWEVYAWQLGLRDQTRCLPVHLGADAPDELLQKTGLQPLEYRNKQALYEWAKLSFNTPYFSPALWGLISLVAWMVLASNGLARHPVAGLQIAGLLYLLSYFLVGFSCDFRYTYFSTMASHLGLFAASAVIWKKWQGHRKLPNNPRVVSPT